MLGTRNFCLVEAASSHWREWCRLEHKDGMNAALLVECQGRHQAAISKGAREISAAEEEAARVIREANAKLAGVRKVVHEEVSGLQLEVSKRQGSCEKSKRGLRAITAQVPPKFTAATEE